jgi:hypothetical protein
MLKIEVTNHIKLQDCMFGVFFEKVITFGRQYPYRKFKINARVYPSFEVLMMSG